MTLFTSLLILIQMLFSTVINAEPPREIPQELFDAYTCNGAIPVLYGYRDDSYSASQPLLYTLEEVDRYIALAKGRKTMYYGKTDEFLYQALDRYAPSLAGKDVAVIGSTIPFYESIVLAYGGYPTTIEHNKIISTDPRLELLTPEEYDAAPRLFDAVLSISSFEHDGLGRYGDPINPNGDLEAMEKAKGMLKEGGVLFLAVPVGKDCLVWNLHRVYGEIRLQALLKGWRIIGYYGFMSQDLYKEASYQVHQPIFVLTPLKDKGH